MVMTTVPRLLYAPAPHEPRVLLRPFEAAYVLQISLTEVRNRLRRRCHEPRLVPIHAGNRVFVSADELAKRVRDDRLALEVLAAILDGRLTIPKPRSDVILPPSLISSAGAI